MSAWSAYAGAAFAAWTGLGLLCLRTRAVRTRFGWAPLGGAARALLGGGGTLCCALSLTFALQADPASFALVLWITQLGMLGLAMALLLPRRSHLLGASLRLASAATVLTAVLPLLAR